MFGSLTDHLSVYQHSASLGSIVGDPQANSLLIVGAHRPLGDDHDLLELRKDIRSCPTGKGTLPGV